jgi:hypothetical protein
VELIHTVLRLARRKMLATTAVSILAVIGAAFLSDAASFGPRGFLEFLKEKPESVTHAAMGHELDGEARDGSDDAGDRDERDDHDGDALAGDGGDAEVVDDANVPPVDPWLVAPDRDDALDAAGDGPTDEGRAAEVHDALTGGEATPAEDGFGQEVAERARESRGGEHGRSVADAANGRDDGADVARGRPALAGPPADRGGDAGEDTTVSPGNERSAAPRQAAPGQTVRDQASGRADRAPASPVEDAGEAPAGSEQAPAEPALDEPAADEEAGGRPGDRGQGARRGARP